MQYHSLQSEKAQSKSDLKEWKFFLLQTHTFQTTSASPGIRL